MFILLGLMSALSLVGCSRDETAAPAKTANPVRTASARATSSASAASGAADAHEPPAGKLVFSPWKPPRKGIEPVAPPKSLLETWRVFVNQNKPRQKKNPRWKKLPPKESVMLDMAPDGSYRCLVTPLEVVGRPTEDLDALDAWVLTRNLRCSSNGWKTWTESPHIVIVRPDGERQAVLEHTDVFLRERIGGEVRETVLILRSDEEDDGRATTGPPKVIDAPQHIEH